MHSLFETLGIEYDRHNRERVDAAIRTILEIPEEDHCPQVWAAIKALSPDERAELPARVAGLIG
jgi:hypothetical protein